MATLLVVSGPSGAGKSSVISRLLERRPDIVWSISATTRHPRPAEVDGTHYWFLSPEEFATREAEDGFLETAEVHGNRYGTPRAPIEAALGEDRIILVEVDVQGARSIRKAMPTATLVFIEPPSREALVERLKARATESPEALERRLRNADEELAAASEFDHRIVNDQVERAVDALVRILERTSRPPEETP